MKQSFLDHNRNGNLIRNVMESGVPANCSLSAIIHNYSYFWLWYQSKPYASDLTVLAGYFYQEEWAILNVHMIHREKESKKSWSLTCKTVMLLKTSIKIWLKFQKGMPSHPRCWKSIHCQWLCVLARQWKTPFLPMLGGGGGGAKRGKVKSQPAVPFITWRDHPLIMSHTLNKTQIHLNIVEG